MGHRCKGNKEGAVRAFMQLQEEGLGKTLDIAGSKGVLQVIYDVGCPR